MFKEIPFNFVQQSYVHDVLDIEAACFANRLLGKVLFRKSSRSSMSVVHDVMVASGCTGCEKVQAVVAKACQQNRQPWDTGGFNIRSKPHLTRDRTGEERDLIKKMSLRAEGSVLAEPRAGGSEAAELRVGGSIAAGPRAGGSDEHLLKLQEELRPLYAGLPNGLLERRVRESGLDLQTLSANARPNAVTCSIISESLAERPSH